MADTPLTPPPDIDVLGKYKGDELKPPPDITPPSDVKGTKSNKQRLEEIGGSGITSGIIGAFTPELIQGAGLLSTGAAVAAPFTSPVTLPLGETLMATGSAMKGGRLAQAGLGLVGGIGAGTAREVGEAKGWSEPTIVTAELVAGGFAPEILPLMKYGLKQAVSGMTGMASKSDISEAINSVAKSIGKDSTTLSEKQKNFIASKLNEMRGGARNITATTEAHNIISRGTGADVQAANREAQRLAQQAAQRAPARETALRRLEDERNSLGPKDNYSVGTSLRERISARKEKLLEERKKQFNEDEKLVNADVDAKQKNGIYIENDPTSGPKYKQLIQSLRNKLIIGKQARTQKMAEHTEPGVLEQLQRVYKAISPVKKEAIDSQGNITYELYPASFKAIDEARRKIGEAAFGKEAEGYAAIGSGLAKELYRELSEIQAAFAPAKKDLIANYEQASQELNVFKTSSGKKATAVEKFDADRYKADPSSLPKTYFNSRQGVKDLVELLDGDVNFVEQMGGNYIAHQLEGKSADQVKAIIKSNEWLKEFPVLNNRINGYQQDLAKAEGLPLSEKVISTAEKQGLKLVGDAEKQAKTILSDRNAVSRMADIITGKGSETLQPQVVQYILREPHGKEVFTKAVGMALADSSPQTIKRTFTDNVVPALRKSQLVDESEIARLSKLVDEIDRTVTSKEKVNRIVKIVAQAITSSVSAGTAGVASPIYGSVLSKLNPF